MPGASYHVTEAELAILETLWQVGPATIRSIAEQRSPDASNSDYATVQKLLDRLESKGCVARDRSSFAHVFRTIVAREDLVDQELREVASKLCEGSMTPLLMHLVRGTELTREQRSMLRRLLAEDAERDRKGQV